MSIPANQDQEESLVYFNSDGPDVNAIESAYRSTVSDLAPYFDQCLRSYDERRNYWAGKTEDLRKNGKDAFPWTGASDTEAHLISERLNTYVSMFINGLGQSNIRAYPVEASDGPRSKIISSFLKWMVATYIPAFLRQMELAANYGLERGLMVTYVGWEKKRRKVLQKVDIEQINQNNPELAQAILQGQADDVLMQLITASFPEVKESRARKAIKDLKTKGVAEMPAFVADINRPDVQTCAPDGEFLMPAWTMDPQRVPICFWVTYPTAQEIESQVAENGWDRGWADYVIERLGGQTQTGQTDIQQRGAAASPYRSDWRNSKVFRVVHAFQRLIDREDGAEGIYRTIFCPDFTGNGEVQGYAKFELMNGYRDYPFIVTRMSADNKQLYDLQTKPEELRGFQQVVKAERDARIDRNSISTVPPTFGPPGLPPPIMRPGYHNTETRPNSIRWGDQPVPNQMSIEVENTMTNQADRIMGLDATNPYSVQIQKFLTDKFLSHVRDVLKATYQAFQRFGPDEVFFRVTGSPDPVRFGRGDPDEDFNIIINFDSLNNDTDTIEARTAQIQSLIAMDRNGRINIDALIEYQAGNIDPVLADIIIMPAEAAQQQVVKQVTDDLTKIYSGIELNARPNGAQIALQVVQTYQQQPDIQARYGADESFRKRIDTYIAGYVFQQQQLQNAEIGRIGAAPAAFGDAPQAPSAAPAV